MKNLNYKINLKTFLTTLLYLILSCTCHVYAQKSQNPIQIEQAIIVLKDGAGIYSVDEGFNKQIINKAVILNNIDIIQETKTQDNKHQASYLNSEGLKKDVSKELQTSIQKNRKEELKKIEKEIDNHEVRKKAFVINNIKSTSSSEEFLISAHSNKDSVVLAYNNYNFSKIFFTTDVNIIKLALDFLHSQKYIYYNSTSLDYCFSSVFSVRPPPVLI